MGVDFVVGRFYSRFCDRTDVSFKVLPESLWVREISAHLSSFDVLKVVLQSYALIYY